MNKTFLTDYLDCTRKVRAKVTLGHDVQELHPFNLTRPTEWTSIHRPQSCIPDELGNLVLRLFIIPGDKHIERLTGNLTFSERGCVGSIKRLDYFRFRSGGFGYILCRRRVWRGHKSVVSGVDRISDIYYSFSLEFFAQLFG